MTATADHTTTVTLAAVTDKIAAADHIPTTAAHDLVDATAPFACAELLHRLANDARQSVRTSTGQYRVVRADYLLQRAEELEAQSEKCLAAVVEAAVSAPAEPIELQHLRAENQALRDQLGAVVDELVSRDLVRCDYIGEHPLTPAQRYARETDVRAAWAAIALTGGAR